MLPSDVTQNYVILFMQKRQNYKESKKAAPADAVANPSTNYEWNWN